MPRGPAVPIGAQSSLQWRKKIRADKSAKVLPTANGRNLGHDAPHSPIDRAHNQHVSAAVARTPDTDPLYICLFKAPGECYGIGIVPDLQPRIYFLSGLTIARTEVPVIVNKHREACLRKSLRIFV
jgi:hypothetical protein